MQNSLPAANCLLQTLYLGEMQNSLPTANCLLQTFFSWLAKCYKYTIIISDKAFVKCKRTCTFAARKRDSGLFWKQAENKKNKVCTSKKGSYLCSPKRKGRPTGQMPKAIFGIKIEKVITVKGDNIYNLNRDGEGDKFL